jgi:hypothetical protein
MEKGFSFKNRTKAKNSISKKPVLHGTLKDFSVPGGLPEIFSHFLFCTPNQLEPAGFDQMKT